MAEKRPGKKTFGQGVSSRRAESSHSEWVGAIACAAKRHCISDDGLYHGVDGCHRFARECGAAYCDFERMGGNVRDLMSATYSGICVIAYDLRPPVGANTWLTWLREGYKSAKLHESAKPYENAKGESPT